MRPMAREVLLWGLPPELENSARAEAQRTGLAVVALPGAGGDVKPPGLAVVGAVAGTAELVVGLKGRSGWSALPVLAVMVGLEPSLVAPLRAAGVVRIMMQDEFLMELPTILRAVA